MFNADLVELKTALSKIGVSSHFVQSSDILFVDISHTPSYSGVYSDGKSNFEILGSKVKGISNAVDTIIRLRGNRL